MRTDDTDPGAPPADDQPKAISIAPRQDNPFGTAGKEVELSASTQALIQREAAEVQAAMVIAKKFPRNSIQSMDRILNTCTRPTFAEDATYAYSRGGTEISGPSIRLAEEMSRQWGNMESGVIELSRANGISECMSYAWDLETNTRDVKRFQVRHWRDTRSGGYALTDERDIYEAISNYGARRKRACILAVIPGDVAEAAVAQCESTLKTKVDITPDAIKKLVAAFEPFKVTSAMIEKRIQRRIDTILPAQVIQLKRVYASLRDNMGRVEDFFQPEESAAADKPSGTADKLRAGINKKE